MTTTKAEFWGVKKVFWGQKTQKIQKMQKNNFATNSFQNDRMKVSEIMCHMFGDNLSSAMV